MRVKRWKICWVDYLSVFQKNSISRSANITALDCDKVIFVTEGEDTIDHYYISYSVLNVVVHVCVYQ